MFHYFVYFLIITVFKIFTDVLYVTESFIDRSLPEHSAYDFIVVGSGSSGGLIATNLKGKVLLIEAGGYGSSVLFNIPIVQPMLLRSKYDWKHETVPQENACQAMNGNKCFWPSGRIISGTHRLNNMIYHRGNERDYEEIVDKSSAAVLFDQVEKNIPVSETNFKSKMAEAFISGAKALGFEDFDFTKLTQFHGKRFTQFYNWWKKSTLPDVVLNAGVTRVLFEGKRAVGIEFIKNNAPQQVYAKNIVLAAGTMGSPKILLHSGVGPRQHLEEIGIDVIEDLPVGKNLQDHVTTNIDLLLTQNIGCSLADVYHPLKIIEYFWSGSGPLSLAGSDAMGFVRLNASLSSAPDLSFILLPLGIADDYGLHLRKTINLKEAVWKSHYERLAGQPFATILPILLHPKSRGSIKLKSKDFDEPVLIDPQYYKLKDDVEVMIKAIRIVQKLIETPKMQELGAELIPKPLYGCESTKFDSDEYWECYMRHLTLTMYHPVGTCRMGDYNDSNTVVLKNFQVKNLHNLFVVDGSVIPNAPSSNPHALISMLAQKFSHDMNTINNDT